MYINNNLVSNHYKILPNITLKRWAKISQKKFSFTYRSLLCRPSATTEESMQLAKAIETAADKFHSNFWIS